MRFSYQRDIIFKSICEVDTHPTAANVFNIVKSQIENISLGTIYRNLAQLVEEDMIQELKIDGVSHYDGNMIPHDHFVCEKCKTIIDFYTKNDWNIDNRKEAKEFDIQKIDIIFSGLCQYCKPN